MTWRRLKGVSECVRGGGSSSCSYSRGKSMGGEGEECGPFALRRGEMRGVGLGILNER